MDEIGTVKVERKWDVAANGYATRITHADPRIRISAELIDSACRGAVADEPTVLTLDGDVLTIRDDYSQRFIYRIRWDDYADGGYLAEWSD